MVILQHVHAKTQKEYRVLSCQEGGGADARGEEVKNFSLNLSALLTRPLLTTPLCRLLLAKQRRRRKRRRRRRPSLRRRRCHSTSSANFLFFGEIFFLSVFLLCLLPFPSAPLPSSCLSFCRNDVIKTSKVHKKVHVHIYIHVHMDTYICTSVYTSIMCACDVPVLGSRTFR